MRTIESPAEDDAGETEPPRGTSAQNKAQGEDLEDAQRDDAIGSDTLLEILAEAGYEEGDVGFSTCVGEVAASIEEDIMERLGAFGKKVKDFADRVRLVENGHMDQAGRTAEATGTIGMVSKRLDRVYVKEDMGHARVCGYD